MLKKIIPLSLFAISLFFTQDLLSADHHDYHTINAQKLKRWIDEEKEMQIFDARTPEYDDGNRISNAALLPCNCNDKAIFTAIPSKESRIIIYCSSPECIASQILSDRLIKLGYRNVYKYCGGIAEWEEKGFGLTQN